MGFGAWPCFHVAGAPPFPQPEVADPVSEGFSWSLRKS